MGIDLFYYAIPGDSPLLEMARQDARFVHDLPFFSSFIRNADEWLKRDTDGTSAQSVALAQQAAREYPGIEGRTFYWRNRAYDAAHFLLSPQRRADPAAWRDTAEWATGAIFGREFIHEKVWTVSGFPVSYSSPERVREYAEQARDITRKELKVNFDPAQMARDAVYKCGGKPNGFELWMWPDIAEWRAFLLSMLDFPGEGLICSMG